MDFPQWGASIGGLGVSRCSGTATLSPKAADPVPVHREPLYTTRRDLVSESKEKGKKKARIYPTFADGRGFRLPTSLASVQAVDFAGIYPLVLITGRLAEYDTDGDASRANAWLADLRRRMFVEMHPHLANEMELREGHAVWIVGPSGGRIRAAAAITRRVTPGVVFMPVSFAGQWSGESLRGMYPDESDGFVLGHPATAILGGGLGILRRPSSALIFESRLESPLDCFW